MLTAPALSDHLGDALATDYFFLREQFTDEQIELLRARAHFVDDEVLPGDQRATGSAPSCRGR